MISNDLDTTRLEELSDLCHLSKCKNRGKHWVHWNDSYPAVFVCGVHLRRRSMSGGGDRPPAPPPVWWLVLQSTPGRRRHPEDHIASGGRGLRCQHCGVENALPFPCSVSVYKAYGKDFAAKHRSCKPSLAGKRRWIYSTPEEWKNSWDTGTSSLVIYNTLEPATVSLGHSRPEPPYDAADFGRCLRLLAVARGWRERLGEVVERHADWKGVVDAWTQLERLYDKAILTPFDDDGWAPVSNLLRELRTT